MPDDLHVLWDPQVFTWQKHGGISRVFAELYRELNGRESGIDLAVAAWCGDNAHAAAAGMPQKVLLPFPGRMLQRGVRRLMNRRYLKRAVRRHAPALLHPTFFEPDFLNVAPDIPFVLTVHDMIHERYATSCLAGANVLRRKKAMLLERAARIIATSEATRRDLIELTSIAPELIDVVYHGSRPALPTPTNRAAVCSRPFLLFVGHRTIYKNFTTFLHGVAPVLQRHDLDLLCVGGAAWSDDEQQLAVALGIAGRIAHRELSDGELTAAYRQAVLFVFPSLYEGFGLPLLEAMSCECPVAASDIPPFREVADAAAAYFDPADAESIGQVVEQVITDNQCRDRLIAAGSRRHMTFSWQRCAEQTIASYRRALRTLPPDA